MNNKPQHLILCFKMAQEAISYSLKVSQLIIDKHVSAADFKKVQKLPHFITDVDWANHPEEFIEQAQALALSVFGFWMITCAQGYFDLCDGKIIDVDKNPDLHAAQSIFAIIRNSFAHPYVAGNCQVRIRWNLERKKKYRKVFTIKALDLTLDARDLHKKEFKLSDLGGWNNLWNLLEYLKDNLPCPLPHPHQNITRPVAQS